MSTPARPKMRTYKYQVRQFLDRHHTVAAAAAAAEVEDDFGSASLTISDGTQTVNLYFAVYDAETSKEAWERYNKLRAVVSEMETILIAAQDTSNGNRKLVEAWRKERAQAEKATASKKAPGKAAA